jgi:hypothetical protein
LYPENGNNLLSKYKDMKTRREFLRDCSIVAGVVALAPVSTLAGPAQTVVSPAEILGFDQFSRQLNTSFTVNHAGEPLALTLAEATQSPAHPATSEVCANENFSLMFRGPSNRPLLQNTYEFVHPKLGPLTIFITPVGQPQDTYRRYEAVFSRPTSTIDLALQIARAPKPAQKSQASFAKG